jgi:hypothetical protein
MYVRVAMYIHLSGEEKKKEKRKKKKKGFSTYVT